MYKCSTQASVYSVSAQPTNTGEGFSILNIFLANNNTLTHAHTCTLKVSIWLSALVSWLQGLWDTPACWQSFLTQAGRTALGICVCASAILTHSAFECVFCFHMCDSMFSSVHGLLLVWYLLSPCHKFDCIGDKNWFISRQTHWKNILVPNLWGHDIF